MQFNTMNLISRMNKAYKLNVFNCVCLTIVSFFVLVCDADVRIWRLRHGGLLRVFSSLARYGVLDMSNCDLHDG